MTTAIERLQTALDSLGLKAPNPAGESAGASIEERIQLCGVS